MSNEEEEELEWDKAVGQFRLALNVVMRPLMLYGQQHYVTTALEELTSLAIQLHWRLSGIDAPFGEGTTYRVNTDKLHW